MASLLLRRVVSVVIIAIIIIAGWFFVWLRAYSGEGEVAQTITATPIAVDVAAITEVIKSPVFAQFVTLAPDIKLGTLGNPNPFPGVRDEAATKPR